MRARQRRAFFPFSFFCLVPLCPALCSFVCENRESSCGADCVAGTSFSSHFLHRKPRQPRAVGVHGTSRPTRAERASGATFKKELVAGEASRSRRQRAATSEILWNGPRGSQALSGVPYGRATPPKAPTYRPAACSACAGSPLGAASRVPSHLTPARMYGRIYLYALGGGWSVSKECAKWRRGDSSLSLLVASS